MPNGTAWVAILAALLLCLTSAFAQDAEKCFRYHVNSTTSSPTYVLKENHETLLKIFDYFADSSVTQILDGENCILSLKERGVVDDPPGCQTVINGNYADFTFGFENRVNEVVLKWKDYEKTLFHGSLKSIRVQTNSTKGTSVIYDCPSESVLYRVDSNTPSPVYELRDNMETVLRILDYNGDSSVTKVLDGNSCIILIKESGAEVDQQTCERIITSDDVQLTFGFQKSRELVTVKRKDTDEFLFEEPLKTIRLETDSKNDISIRFSFPTECYEFENDLIRPEFLLQEMTQIFGRRIHDNGVLDSSVQFTTRTDTPENLGGYWREMNSLLRTDCWYLVNFTAKLSYGQIDLLGSFQSTLGESRYLASVKGGPSTHFYLDFTKSVGIRWRSCGTESTSDTLPQCDDIASASEISPKKNLTESPYTTLDSASQSKGCISMLCFYITIPVWGFLFILTIVIATVTYKLKEFGHNQNSAENIYDDIIVPTKDASIQVMINNEEEENLYEEVPEPPIYNEISEFLNSEEEEPIYEEIEDLFPNDQREHIHLQPV